MEKLKGLSKSFFQPVALCFPFFVVVLLVILLCGMLKKKG